MVSWTRNSFPGTGLAEIARDVDVLAERTPDQADLPPRLERHVDRLLDSVDVGRERGDENAALALGDDLAEDLAHGLLRERHPWALGVRGVTEKEIDAAVAEVGELAQIGAETIDR